MQLINCLNICSNKHLYIVELEMIKSLFREKIYKNDKMFGAVNTFLDEKLLV